MRIILKPRKNKPYEKYLMPFFLSLFILCFSCSENENPVNGNGNGNDTIPKVKQIVRLQNQSDHSEIMVSFLGVDSFTITDSLGHFSLPQIPDSYYVIEARYPYFEPARQVISVVDSTIVTDFEMVLKQQIQFWVEPAETTISMNNGGSSIYFEMSGFKHYRLNITDKPVTLISFNSPITSLAFDPQGFEWADSIGSQSCLYIYGMLLEGPYTSPYSITFLPGDTTYYMYPGTYFLKRACFRKGGYYFFTTVIDESNVPGYFGQIYDFYDKTFQKMNHSLLKKKELFRPALVHITD